MFLQSASGCSPVALAELDYSWWKDHVSSFPVVFLSESPSLVWCEVDERLLRKLVLDEGYSLRAFDSALIALNDEGRRIATLPAAALSSMVWVSVSLGLDGIPWLSIFGKSFPIEVSPSLYVDSDGRIGAPRGFFLERWKVSDLLRVKSIADYWR